MVGGGALTGDDREDQPNPRARFGLVGEAVLLVWVLGVLGYFYYSRGYLDLARQVLGI